MSNVTNIADNVATSSPLVVIVRRRHAIKQRCDQIREQQGLLTQECNDLWKEDRELERAEAAVRKLMEKAVPGGL